MIGEDPYRRPDRSLHDEEDLWLRLDWALERAIQDPQWAWGIAWQVAKDSARHPDVRRAAEELMRNLGGELEY